MKSSGALVSMVMGPTADGTRVTIINSGECSFGFFLALSDLVNISHPSYTLSLFQQIKADHHKARDFGFFFFTIIKEINVPQQLCSQTFGCGCENLQHECTP